jgi:pantetheine-phosphate adenylyltransferase
MKTVVYPGTFNPITNGHTDLVERAAGIFERVIVAVGTSTQKASRMSLDERVALCRQVLAHLPNIEVCGFTGLLTDFVRARGASLILRGLRTVADFEYEFQLVGMNRVLAPEIETVFLAPAEHLAYISSTLVREIAAYGGDISQFVDPLVAAAMRASFAAAPVEKS